MGTSFRRARAVVHDLWERLPATLELTFVALVIGVVGGVGSVCSRRASNGQPPSTTSSRFFAPGLVAAGVLDRALLLYVFSPDSAGCRVLAGYPRGPRTRRITGFFTSTRCSTVTSAVQAVRCTSSFPASVLGWASSGSSPGWCGRPAGRVQHGVRPRRSGDGAARAHGRQLPRAAQRPAPTITIVGFTFAFLLTGAVLTETVFTWPGVGSYAVEARADARLPGDHRRVTSWAGIAFLITNLVTDVAVRPRRPTDPAVVTAVDCPRAVPDATPGRPVAPRPRSSRRRHRWVALAGRRDHAAAVGAVRPARTGRRPAASPQLDALMGTDALGRDVFTRALWGRASRCRCRSSSSSSAVIDRHVVGRDLRLLRRLGRRGAHAVRRHHHGLPADPAGHGDHRVARARAPQRADRDGARVVADLRPACCVARSSR